MIVAVTGTVGSGKSRVSAMLAAALGCESVDTDTICRQLMLPGMPGWDEMQKRWETRFIGADGQVDRSMLREAVFTDLAVRRELEAILHPLVKQRVTAEIGLARERKQNLLLEIPLLYEVGWQDGMDGVVAVYVPRRVSVARTSRRDDVDRQQVESILAAQLSALQKAERADWVIDNSGLWAATALQVAHLAWQWHVRQSSGNAWCIHL
ncbi:MAG: dephospho-CoA kinase [Desulfopila sp.]